MVVVIADLRPVTGDKRLFCRTILTTAFVDRHFRPMLRLIYLLAVLFLQAQSGEITRRITARRNTEGDQEMQKLNKALSLLIAGLLVAGCATQPEKKEETKAVTEAQPAPAPAAKKADDSYSVVRGDHLWGISSKPTIYGNPYQWPLIFKANRDKIKDADLIQPGQVLSINRNASAAEVDAAVRHAKTRGAWTLGVVEESDKRYLAQ
jgi:LysM repeat protein